jgi:hypothetical protein
MSPDPNRQVRRDLRDLVATAMIDSQRQQEKDASGWVVAVVDDESNRLVMTVGLFPTPEAALIHGEQMHATDVRLAGDSSDALWSHVVLPMFSPDNYEEALE